MAVTGSCVPLCSYSRKSPCVRHFIPCLYGTNLREGVTVALEAYTQGNFHEMELDMAV